MAFRSISVALIADTSQYRRALGDATSDTKRFAAEVERSGHAASGASSGAEEAAKRAGISAQQTSRAMLVAGAGLLAGFGFAERAVMGFDKQLSNVAAVSNATGGELGRLREAALEAGKATSFSASEAAQAEAELARAGISTADILGGALRGSLDLAAAGQLDLGEAASISATAMNQFSLSGGDVGRIADTLAAGANKSAADVRELADSLGQSGQVAAQFGLSFEDTIATLSLFADAGLRGSDAGTSLRTMLLALANPSKEAQATMEMLGVAAYDAQGNFVGMAELSGQLQTKLGGLTQQQRDQALATIFGSDAIRAANVLLKAGSAGFAEYARSVNDQGAASRFASAQMDNLAGDLERLKGSIETALIQGGSAATGVLRTLAGDADSAVQAFSSLPSGLQASITGLGTFVGLTAVTAGAVGTLKPKFDLVRSSLDEMGVAGQRASAGLGILGKAGAGAAAVLVLGESIHVLAAAIDDAIQGKPKLDELQVALLDLGKGGAGFQEVERIARNAQHGIKDLATELHELGGPGSKFRGSDQFRNVARGIELGVEDIDKALASIVRGGAPDAAATALNRFLDSLHLPAAARSDLLPFFTQYRGALDETAAQARVSAEANRENQATQAGSGVSAGAAAAAQAGLGGAFGASADKAVTLDDALKSMNDQLDQLIGKNVSAEQADIRFRDSLDAIGKAFVDNGGSIDINTEAGRKNRSAILDSITALTADAQAQADRAQNIDVGTFALQAHRNALVEVLTKTLGSRQAAEAYVNQLGLIPQARITDIRANVDSSGIFGFISALDAIYGKAGDAEGAVLRLVAAQRALALAGPLGPGGTGAPALGLNLDRAAGGPVRAGERYLVGEEGPELVEFARDGVVRSAPHTRQLMSGMRDGLVPVDGGGALEPHSTGGRGLEPSAPGRAGADGRTYASRRDQPGEAITGPGGLVPSRPTLEGLASAQARVNDRLAEGQRAVAGFGSAYVGETRGAVTRLSELERAERSIVDVKRTVITTSEEAALSANRAQATARPVTDAAVLAYRTSAIEATRWADTVPTQLSEAMARSTLIMAAGGTNTAGALQRALSSGTGPVRLVAAQYSGDLLAAVNRVLTAVGAPPVRALAAGGLEDHTPRIASGGGPIVWNERELPWEGFVSGHPRYLERSKSITVEIARRLDMVAMPRSAFEAQQRSGSHAAAQRRFETVDPSTVPGGRFAAGGLTVSANERGLPPPPLERFVAAGTAGRAGTASTTRAYDDASRAVASARDRTLAPAAPGGPVSGNVAQWLRMAVEITHTPLYWLPGLLRLTMAESGGNPRVVNATPVGREHATGILQTLPSTFRANALPGYGDIFNPVHNAIAAIRYIARTWGTVYDTPLFHGGHYVGYAAGGIGSPSSFRAVTWPGKDDEGLGYTTLPPEHLNPVVEQVRRQPGARLPTGFEYGGKSYRGPQLPGWNPKDAAKRRQAEGLAVGDYDRRAKAAHDHAHYAGWRTPQAVVRAVAAHNAQLAAEKAAYDASRSGDAALAAAARTKAMEATRDAYLASQPDVVALSTLPKTQERTTVAPPASPMYGSPGWGVDIGRWYIGMAGGGVVPDRGDAPLRGWLPAHLRDSTPLRPEAHPSLRPGMAEIAGIKTTLERGGLLEDGDRPRWMSDLATMRLPSFGGGGTVPGVPGEPRVILAHGGEHVVPVQPIQPIRIGASAGAGATNVARLEINVPLHLEGARFGADVTERDVQGWVEKGVKKAGERFMAGLGSTR